jgi:hypothetical protein
MSHFKTLKLSCVAALLSVSTLASAKITVNLTTENEVFPRETEPTVYINALDKEIYYFKLLSSISGDKYDHLTDEQKINEVRSLTEKELDDFELREQKKSLLQQYDNYIQQAKEAISNVDKFTYIHSEDRVFESNKYDFDKQEYYFVGYPDKAEQENFEWNKEMEINLDKDTPPQMDYYYFTTALCNKLNQFILGRSRQPRILVNQPSCKFAVIKLPTELAKEASKGNSFAWALHFTFENKNEIMEHAGLATTLQTPVIAKLVKEEKDSEGKEIIKVIYETPVEFRK